MVTRLIDLEEAMDKIASTIDKVSSRDGTLIAYHRSGTGPPLVLVPGAGAANPVAWTVFPELQQRFTVYAVDRRGHGESGDSPSYAIQREFEDIAAVVDSIEEPVNLLGHSFGGLISLEAALHTNNIRKLVLYDGVPVLEASLFPEGIIDKLQALLDEGDPEGMLVMFYSESVGMSSEEIEQFKSSPAWPVRLAAAQTLPRELRAVDQYRFDPKRFKNLNTPTLLLLGSESPQFAKEDTETANAALPNSEIIEMPGQQHIAMYTAPNLFLREVVTFIA